MYRQRGAEGFRNKEAADGADRRDKAQRGSGIGHRLVLRFFIAAAALFYAVDGELAEDDGDHVFMGLFLTAGLGSGSTFQMIAVIFRQLTIDSVKQRGGSDEEAQHEGIGHRLVLRFFIAAAALFYAVDGELAEDDGAHLEGGAASQTGG